MTTYKNVLNIYPDIASHKYIGGWSEEDGTVYLWYREDGERKIVSVPEIKRYFLVTKKDFFNIGKEKWKSWKKQGIIDDGDIVDDYVYIFVNPKLRRYRLDNFFN